MESWQSQILKLVHLYPTYASLRPHLNDDGSIRGCCLAAVGTVDSVVTTMSEITEVMNWAAETFSWGGHRCPFVCQAVQKREAVDCGTRGCLSMAAMRLSQPCTTGVFRVAGLQMVRRCGKQEGKRWLESFASKQGDTFWVEEDVSFHQAVAIIKPDDSFDIWDYGRNYLYPDNHELEGALMAIRVSSVHLPTDHDQFADAVSHPAPLPAMLSFEGRSVPLNEWVTLLPAAQRIAGINDIAIYNQPKPMPLRATPTVSSIVDGLHLPHRDVLPHAPTIYISGCSMNNGNPLPGVGVGRCLRARFPNAKLIGVDFSEEAGGLIDSVFDDVLVIGFAGCSSVKNHWDDVVELLMANPTAFFLPTMDAEVELLSRCLEDLSTEQERADLRHRVLVPSISGLEPTGKPEIEAGQRMGMTCPVWMRTSGDVSEHDLHAFGLHHGYPVYVKGPDYGASLCSSWGEIKGALKGMDKLWGSGSYLQEDKTGLGMGIMFAAVDGELVGAVLNHKMTVTPLQKSWAGKLTAVPADLFESLKTVVKELRWTGGGEIEYTQALDGERFIVDWNPRFPANIFGACYAGVNLPGALIQHVLAHNPALAAACLPQETEATLVPLPADCHRAAVADVTYGRTVMEVPWMHTQPMLTSLPGKTGFSANIKGHPSRLFDVHNLRNLSFDKADKADKTPTNERPSTSSMSESEAEVETPSTSQDSSRSESDAGSNKCDEDCTAGNIGGASFTWSLGTMQVSTMPSVPELCRQPLTSLAEDNTINIPPTSTELILANDDCDLTSGRTRFKMSCPEQIRHELRRLLPSIKTTTELATMTPRFVMSRDSCRELMLSIKQAVTLAAEQAGIANVHLCLSIKTQPHEAVLKTALELGYLPEAISAAEARSALSAGFALEDLVFNGPAKWYDLWAPLNNDAGSRLITTPDIERNMEPLRPWRDVTFHNSNTAGQVDTSSMPEAPKVKMIFADSLTELRQIVDMVSSSNHWLDADVVGVRFMPPCVAGSRFGVESDDPAIVAAVAEEIKRLPARFKLGTHFHFASSTMGLKHWRQVAKGYIKTAVLLEQLSGRQVEVIDFGGGWASHLLDDQDAIAALTDVYSCAKQQLSGVTTVVCEPGKCVSERAGGLVVRVQSVRELNGKRAAITDGSVAEGAALMAHPHPVLLLRNNQWTVLPPGSDRVSGRTCMEWDDLSVNVELPEDIREGDMLMVAFTGAYDTTISYNFGDGSARAMTMV